MPTSSAAEPSVYQLRALADRQKEQLQQQKSVMIAREQRLHYLQQQQEQSKSSRYNGQMHENRLKELRASTFGNRLQRRSDSCKSTLQYYMCRQHVLAGIYCSFCNMYMRMSYKKAFVM